MMDNLKKSWSVGYKMKIDSNVDNLWKIITKPGHLEMVHPCLLYTSDAADE